MPQSVMVIPENVGSGRLCCWPGSLFAPDCSGVRAALEAARTSGSRVIAWSGSFAEVDGGGLFDEDPRTWGPKGWAAVERACGGMDELAGSLLIRPHARHVVSDVPGCRRLLDADWAAGLGLAYDPASMCSEAMVVGGRLEDHLRRMYEAIELMPAGRIGAVIVAGVAAGGPTGARLTPLSESGALGAIIAKLASRHIPEGVGRLVLSGSDIGVLA